MVRNIERKNKLLLYRKTFFLTDIEIETTTFCLLKPAFPVIIFSFKPKWKNTINLSRIHDVFWKYVCEALKAQQKSAKNTPIANSSQHNTAQIKANGARYEILSKITIKSKLREGVT